MKSFDFLLSSIATIFAFAAICFSSCQFHERQEGNRSLSDSNGSNRDSTISVKDVTTENKQVLKDTTIIVADGLSFNIVAVEGGTFTMGASEDDTNVEEDCLPAHKVTLSDYYIAETEVTQELWEAVMGENPCEGEDYNFPVHNIGWKDCLEFIEKLNDLLDMNFRLPTEAEWEYAARGGKKSKGFKYSGSNRINEVAWFDNNSDETLHSVKQKKPNELGLYDMSGNAEEFCSDWYDSYKSENQTNPTGPSSPNEYELKVLRGGTYNTPSDFCRVFSRGCDCPDCDEAQFGFRLALSL